MLNQYILTNNVVGMQKSFRELLEKHFNNAIRKVPIYEDIDTQDVEPQVISALIRYAHECNSTSYKYEAGLFSVDFTTKTDTLEFIDLIDDYYWVRHYEVDMTITDEMVSIDLDSLPDDATGLFSVHLEIDSSIVQYPKGHVNGDNEVINEKATPKTKIVKDKDADYDNLDDDDDDDCGCNQDDDYITETAAKKKVVFRHGEKTIEMQCPKGTIFNPHTKQCRKMKSSEIRNRRMALLRTQRKEKSQLPAMNKSRNKSLRKRKAANL